MAQNAPVATVDGGAGRRQHGEANRDDTPIGIVVARLSNEVECEWRLAGGSDMNRGERFTPAMLPLGTEFHAGQQLNLTAGLAELTFTSGAKIILHAPVQFTATTALGGDLQFGRIAAKVPHEAAGFTVNTLAGKVVDLGTEFGVSVGAAHDGSRGVRRRSGR